VSWCSPMSASLLPTECRKVCQPAPAIPSFANAGLIIRFSTAPRSSGFLPLLRTDGNTKSVSVAYKLWPRHSRRAFFSGGCIGKGFADASVFVALRYPPRRRGGACCLQREVRVEGIGGGNVGKGREITGSGREKGRGVAIVSGAAVIGDWSNRIKTVTRSEYSADIGGQRGPTEVGVKLVNSVELRLGATAFEDLFQCQMDEVPESVAVS
jgi:hypothetical protein